MLRTLLRFLFFVTIANSAVAFEPDQVLRTDTKGVMVYQGSEEVSFDLYRKDGRLLRHVDSKTNELEQEWPAIVAFAADYGMLVLDCVAVTPRYYVVMLNRESRELGYIKKSDPQFRFETWPQHLTKLVAIRYDSKSNPLHAEPNIRSAVLVWNNTPDEPLSPQEVKGDWLRIEWRPGGQTRTGWIRWREGYRFLIEMYHLC